jgi:hypothetical protein
MEDRVVCTYSRPGITSGDEFAKVDDVVQPTGAAVVDLNLWVLVLVLSLGKMVFVKPDHVD